jgi:hypothetical protein
MRLCALIEDAAAPTPQATPYFWWNPDLFRELRPSVPRVVSRNGNAMPMKLPPRQHSFASALISFRSFLKGNNAPVGQADIQSRALPLSADQIEIVLDI